MTETHITNYQAPGHLSALHEKFGAPFAAYRDAWERASNLSYLPPYPLALEIELNNNCNLSCKMCHFAQLDYHSAGGTRFMSLDLIRRIIEFCEGRIPSIMPGSATECFLHPQYREIIQLFQDAPGVMDQIVSTNGLLMTEAASEFLVAAQVARVWISMDAVKEDTYRKIRGADLKRLEKNVLGLAKAKERAGSKLPYINLSFVVQDLNRDEVPAFRDKWMGLVDGVTFQNLMQWEMGATITEETRVEYPGSCPQPFQRLVIDVDGTVFPCCSYYKKDFPLENVADHSLEELWNCDRIQHLRETLRKREFQLACKQCLGQFEG